jgi:hypothetical protein
VGFNVAMIILGLLFFVRHVWASLEIVLGFCVVCMCSLGVCLLWWHLLLIVF